MRLGHNKIVEKNQNACVRLLYLIGLSHIRSIICNNNKELVL